MNPVLREGNSDRRAAIAVKNYAKANPHSMGDVVHGQQDQRVDHDAGDFRANETSVTLTAAQAGKARIELTARDGTVTVLKDGVSYPAGTVVDATFMSAKALARLSGASRSTRPRRDGMLFSLHLKATMMKVSDPIIFGHAVTAYPGAGVRPVTARRWHAAGREPEFRSWRPAGRGLPRCRMARPFWPRSRPCIADRPPMYMVNSDKGITNLHVPSDVIIDASMPGADPRGRQGLGPGRQGSRHQLRDPRQLLCAGL